MLSYFEDGEEWKTIIQLLRTISSTPNHSIGSGKLSQNMYPKSKVQPSLVYIREAIVVAEVTGAWYERTRHWREKNSNTAEKKSMGVILFHK